MERTKGEVRWTMAQAFHLSLREADEIAGRLDRKERSGKEQVNNIGEFNGEKGESKTGSGQSDSGRLVQEGRTHPKGVES